MAVLDVPPQVLSRNITFGSSFGDGKSRGATGRINSSEAWFIYLTFRYWDCGALLHFVLTAKFERACRGRESDCRDRQSAFRGRESDYKGR